jgi:hypothetical protein
MKHVMRSLAEIDKALNSPNMVALRKTLDDTAKSMRPLLDIAQQAKRNELENRHRFDLGSYR